MEISVYEALLIHLYKTFTCSYSATSYIEISNLAYCIYVIMIVREMHYTNLPRCEGLVSSCKIKTTTP